MIYQTQLLTNSEYRVLPVKKYLVFYVILEDTVEIRRIVYARVDLDEMLRLPKQEFEIIFAPLTHLDHMTVVVSQWVTAPPGKAKLILYGQTLTLIIYIPPVHPSRNHPPYMQK
jgi:hypothetical protein